MIIFYYRKILPQCGRSDLTSVSDPTTRQTTRLGRQLLFTADPKCKLA